MDKRFFTELSCAQCANAESLDFDISFAFQPIVSATSRRVVAYEALVRGTEGQSAGEVFSKVNEANLYRFDQTCRVKAIRLAMKLGIVQPDTDTLLHLNFSPNAVYKPELCIRTTVQAARQYGLPIDRIIFEVTESERVKDHAHLVEIIECYRQLGFKTAIDDFGAGYSGLNLLAEYQPDQIKIDRALIADIQTNTPRQAIVRGIVQVCRDLGITVLAEGVEQREEYEWLAGLGIDLFQGYWFARPGFQTLPEVSDELY